MNKICCLIGCLVGVALFVAVNSESCQYDAYTVMEIHCKGRKICFNKTAEWEICDPVNGTIYVYDRDTAGCVPEGTPGNYCNQDGTCAADYTGPQADPGCKTFFACVGGSMWPNSRRYCPASLLFDGVTCNTPAAAPASCSTP